MGKYVRGWPTVQNTAKNQQKTKTTKSKSLLVRHTTEELRELIQRSQELYPRAVPGIKWSERKSQWTSPRGGRLWMSYLDKDTDVTRYQGLRL